MKAMNEIKTATTKPAPTAPVPTGPKSGQAVPTKASTAQGQTLPPPAKSPRRWVRFEIDAPGARAVSVAGTFNNWVQGATPLWLQGGLQGSGGTRWVRDVPVASDPHEYRFVVDGKWTDDPNAKAYAPNPHGGRNAILTPDRFTDR